MSKIFDETVRLSIAVLETLSKGNYCWNELLKLTIRRSGSPWKFSRIMRYLVDNSYIVKLGEKGKRAPYKITERGMDQLKIWKNQSK